MSRLPKLIIVMFLAGCQLATLTRNAAAGRNPDFTLPLHAKIDLQAACDGYRPVDCLGNRPTINVPANIDVTVYLFVMNFTEVTAVQTAFQWGPGWVLMDSSWDCQPHQITGVTPHDPGGPNAGTIATAFDCVTQTSLAPIGRMFFLAGTSGCLRQVQSSYPYGVAILDCVPEFDLINANDPVEQLRLGRVCVGVGGHDACDPLATLAEPTTWGEIKASYR